MTLQCSSMAAELTFIEPTGMVQTEIVLQVESGLRPI